MWFLEASSQSCIIVTSPLCFSRAPDSSSFPSSKEDNKDDEEDNEDQKDLDHQPAVGGDWLEVFEDLHVSSLHIQLGVLHVGVDSGTGQESRFNNSCSLLLIKVGRNISGYKVN